MSRFLNVHEVADVLGVTPTTIYRLSERGELASVKLSPRLLRFTTEAVEDFIAARTRPVATASRNDDD